MRGIDPASHFAVDGFGRRIGFRFEDLAVDAIDHFVPDERLAFPGEEVFNRILVGEIALEEACTHLRFGEGTDPIGWLDH